MDVLRIYYEDLHIARALLRHDESVTRQFFYKQCFPLFKSVYDNYYTDCTAVKEFIDEVYLLVLTPNKQTGRCQLENFRGESTLTSWLKSACLFYCYKKYRRKSRSPMFVSLPNLNDEKFDDNDRLIDLGGSSELDISNMNRQDIKAIMALMPNKRYRKLIQLRYLEMMSNEETAKELGLSMENYYNIHLRAKAQYTRILNMEEYYYG